MQRVAPLLTGAVLSLHLLGAALFAWITPGGFPVQHPRFWVNTALPGLILAAASLALFVGRARLPMLTALAGFWSALALSTRLTFPSSGRIVWLALLAISASIAILAIAERRHGRRRGVALALSVALAGAIGAALPPLERAPAPATHPANQRFAGLPTRGIDGVGAELRLSQDAKVWPASGTVAVARGPYLLFARPLLTFESRSPDRGWTIFAPEMLRRGPARR